MPSKTYPIEAPGGFAPVFALGSDDGSGQLALVSHGAPLPTVALAPVAPAPLNGSASNAKVAGPFAPTPLAPVFLTLTGEWTGTVRILRSIDGGATRHPLTIAGSEWAVFHGNACEPVWQEGESGAQLYLDIAPTSGTLTYRIAQ